MRYAFITMISVAVTFAVLYTVFFWNNQSSQTLPTQGILHLGGIGSTPRSPAAVPEKRMSLFTQEVLDGIEKLLVFMGYPHSGHSILCAMLDAHPNIVLTTDYFLLRNWKEIKKRVNGDKYKLCSEMVLTSLKASPIMHTEKGYSLVIPSQWQGSFSQLKIIGDKSAGKYAENYNKEWSAKAEQTFNDIEQLLKTPVLIIHLVRNPFDMIATHILTEAVHKLTHLAKHRWDHNVTKLKLPGGTLSKVVKLYHKLASGVLAIKRDWASRYRMLEIHHADFVYNPKEILQQICDFLAVNCPKDYLEACDIVAFKSLSKSRDLLDWPPEIAESVNNLINEFPFFSRYSFDSD